MIHRTLAIVPRCAHNRSIWPALAALALTTGLTSGRAGTPTIAWEQVYFERPTTLVRSPSGLDAVTFGNGMFVAVGDSIMVSTNGSDWTKIGSPTRQTLHSVTFGGNKFVAVGGGFFRRAAGPGFSAIVVSEDGFHWTTVLERKIEALVPDEQGLRDFFLRDVIYAKNQFVAVGGGNGKVVMTSPDGLNWTEVTTDVLRASNAIAFGNGKYVLAGNGVMTSDDGVHWTEQHLDFGVELFEVAFGAGRFVACGNGVMITSPDGIHWTNGWTQSLADFWGCAFGQGVFVCPENTQLALVGNPDGEWTAESLLSDPNEVWGLGGVVYADGQFIAVGEFNLILRGRIAAHRPSFAAGSSYRSGQGFEFNLGVELNRNYEIQLSEDLVSWRTLTNLSSSAPVLKFTAPDEPRVNHRFYRAIAK